MKHVKYSILALLVGSSLCSSAQELTLEEGKTEMEIWINEKDPFGELNKKIYLEKSSESSLGLTFDIENSHSTEAFISICDDVSCYPLSEDKTTDLSMEGTSKMLKVACVPAIDNPNEIFHTTYIIGNNADESEIRVKVNWNQSVGLGDSPKQEGEMKITKASSVMTTLQFDAKTTYENLHVNCFDIMGNLVKKVDLNSASGVVLIETADFASGLYVFQLVGAGETLGSEKYLWTK